MLRLRDAFSLPLVSASEGALRNWRRTERAGLATLLVIFVCSSAYAATVVSGHDSIPTVLWRWAPLLAIGLFGAWVHFRRDRSTFWCSAAPPVCRSASSRCRRTR